MHSREVARRVSARTRGIQRSATQVSTCECADPCDMLSSIWLMGPLEWICNASGMAKVRQEACRKANLESIEDFRRSQRLRHATDQEEERRMEEATRARDKIGEKIWCAYNDHLKWLADEDKKRHEAQEEEERRWREREQMEEDHRKCVVAYRQQGHKEWLQVGLFGRLRHAAESTRRIRTCRDPDVTPGRHDQGVANRESQTGSRQPGEEKKEQVKAEEENEKKFQAITQSLWEEDDNQFFKYADELIQDSQAKGRMLLPLQRTIYLKDEEGEEELQGEKGGGEVEEEREEGDEEKGGRGGDQGHTGRMH
ncbi:Protein of unknown function [Gryllus bimaculatus]|nr:Protein of unknown function [Gryllus bimaculatus]